MDFEGLVEGVENDFMYKGTCFGYPFTLENVKRSTEFQFKSTDIIVAGFPKTGTTWVREITWLLCNHGDSSKADNIAVQYRVPCLESHYEGFPPSVEMAEQMSDPRLFCTHLPYSMMDPSIDETKPKVLLVSRNPKDTLVSYWNFFGRIVGRRVEKFNDIFKLFKENRLLFGNPLDTVASWWQGYPRNLLLITFEQLKHDPTSRVKAIADFIETGSSDDVIKEVVAATSLQSMKSRNVYLRGSFNAGAAGNAAVDFSFARKGVTGDWRNVFTPEQSDYVDKLCEEKWQHIGVPLNYEQ